MALIIFRFGFALPVNVTNIYSPKTNGVIHIAPNVLVGITVIRFRSPSKSSMEIIFDRSECPVPRFCPVLHGTSFPFGFPSKKTLSPVRYRGKLIDPLSPEGRGCSRFHIVCQNIRCLIWGDSTSVSTIGYAAIFCEKKSLA